MAPLSDLLWETSASSQALGINRKKLLLAFLLKRGGLLIKKDSMLTVRAIRQR